MLHIHELKKQSSKFMLYNYFSKRSYFIALYDTTYSVSDSWRAYILCYIFAQALKRCTFNGKEYLWQRIDELERKTHLMWVSYPDQGTRMDPGARKDLMLESQRRKTDQTSRKEGSKFQSGQHTRPVKSHPLEHSSILWDTPMEPLSRRQQVKSGASRWKKVKSFLQ